MDEHLSRSLGITMSDTITALAEIQGHIATIRELAKAAAPGDAEDVIWIADQLEAQARRIDAIA